ncbi:MAG: putative integral rane protein [Actinomycetia bacterium]|nr:putative integral rane protein [Actinomycetes bacterium]
MRVSSNVKAVGREAATSRSMQWLARAGLVARGVNYMLIGVLAVQIGLGIGGKEADRGGALHAVAGHPGGTVVLWLLAAGFAGLTLWRLAEAAYGQAGPQGHKAGKRLASLARGIFYGFVFVGVVSFLMGNGGQSGNGQSKDFTAKLMSHPGGRWLVLLIGLVVVGAGVAMVVGGVRKEFRKQLNLAGLNPRSRRVIETLGTVGVAARGIVFGVVGVFLVVAAVSFDAKKAQGIDGSLRKIATTPLGPWLLIAVALGLVTFGVYSCCEARWRKVQPG